VRDGRFDIQQPQKVVTRSHNRKHWALGILTAPLVVCGALRAEDSPAAESILTIGRLFGAKEFDTEPLPARR
jgi:hypothetical protein